MHSLTQLNSHVFKSFNGSMVILLNTMKIINHIMLKSFNSVLYLIDAFRKNIVSIVIIRTLK